MFLQGEARTRFVPDFRTEVHDSDGLLLQTTNGGWIWRPLVNPEKEHQTSHFAMDNPKGFGLLQRDREFGHYEDLQSRIPSIRLKP
jgi:glucans biosynthesis protein